MQYMKRGPTRVQNYRDIKVLNIINNSTTKIEKKLTYQEKRIKDGAYY